MELCINCRVKPIKNNTAKLCGPCYRLKYIDRYLAYETRARLIRKDKKRAYMKIYSKNYYKNNREKIIAYSKAHRNEYKNKMISWRKKYDDMRRYGGKRKVALKRDDYHCQICGESNNLIVHHIDQQDARYKSGKPNNTLNNLITLCSSCHKITHNLGKKGMDYLIRRPTINSEP